MIAKKITVKEGPLVFLRDVLGFEILTGLFFFAVSFLENYELFLRDIGVLEYVRYDLLIMVAFSTLQIIIITSLFLRWYFSYYEIRETEIVRRSGIVLRKHVSVPLNQIATVEFSQGIVERTMKHGTIVLEHTNNRITRLRNVENYEDALGYIKERLAKLHDGYGMHQKKPVPQLIKQGESSIVEFKETLRTDTRNGGIHKDVERAVVKTIVGFLNAQGGTLVIGVHDSGKIMGLEKDYDSLPRKNRDGFENHIATLVKNHIGIKFRPYLTIIFESIDGKDVCVVDVEPSPKPAYLKGGEGKEEFFVRTGNSTQPFSMSEAEEYIKSRWG